MKPSLLIMQAFGPFSGRIEIPFHTFTDQTLFLIHGPTGSGKTTILDAICFALYGETSGNERDSSGMRSHHTVSTLITEVTFEFYIGSTLYRVSRTPEQERTKLRGTGVTKQLSIATLWKIPADPSEQPAVLADRWVRVTEKIESLLGFKSDQFRQIVVIPQGQFRKFLSANSQERQEILAVLFKTAWFKKIEDALKNNARKIKSEFETVASQRTFILNQLSIETADQGVNNLQQLATDIEKLHSEAESLRSREKVQTILLQESKIIEEKFIELTAAQNDLNNLRNQQDLITSYTLKLKSAQKAEQLRSPWEQLQKLTFEHSQMCIKKDNAGKELHKASDAVQKSQQELTKSQEDETLLDRLKIEFEELKKLSPKIDELEKIENNLLTKKQNLQECENKKREKKEHLQKIKVALEKLQQESERIRDCSLLIEQRQKELADAENVIKQFEKLEGLKKQSVSVTVSLQTTADFLQKANISYTETKQRLEILEDARLKGQASILASALLEGSPCPVCGSLTHPAPAPLNKSIPDEKEIKVLKDGLIKLEQKRDDHKASVDTQREKLALIQHEISMLEEIIKENKNLNDTVSIQAWYAECKIKLSESVQAESRISKLENDKARGVSALQQTEKELEQLELELNSAISNVSSDQALFTQYQSEIPQNFRKRVFLDKVISEKKSHMEYLSESINNAKRNHEKSREQLISAQSHLVAAEQNVIQYSEKVSLASEDFSSQLSSCGFSDKEDFQKNLIDENGCKELEQKINEYNLANHSAEQRLKRASDDCENQERPDLKKIESDLSAIRVELETINTKTGALKKEYEQIRKLLSDLEALENRLKKIETDYRLIGSLSDAASGINPLRITFERFVLSSLLDEVLYTGSVRLKMMSRNRFELHRARSHEDQRTSGGLDLMVFDSWTGTTRPISSLSGGESFLAALSLALGLADIVQSYAGGLKLDTMFIDEGFGSLDAEALDLAFNALHDIGKNGRLIGVISHVSELKERINCRLEVLSSRDGSRINVIK